MDLVSAYNYLRGTNEAAPRHVNENVVDLNKNTIHMKSGLKFIIRFARPISDGRRGQRLSLNF